MRRLTVAFVILFCASVLAACGDAGDHFGEFRQQPPPPATLSTVTAQMPIIPGPSVKSAQLPLYVTGYVGGQAVAQNTSLVNPIVITTNYVGYVKFSSPTGGAKKYNSLNLEFTPPKITVYYTRPPYALCKNASVPPVVITIFNHDAKPQFVTLNLSGCSNGPSPSPTPSTKPTKSPKPTSSPSTSPSTSPTPLNNVVKRLSLSMPATPNPLSPGTFTLVVNAFGASGAAIPTGTALAHAINISSNSSCSLSFTFNGTNGTGISVATAPGSVLVAYTPPSGTCTPPSTVVISAFNQDASPNTAQFSLLGGTATVASLSFSMLAPPNTTSQGVYPLFITAKDSSGATIPYGVSLTNPIQLSTNASCATGFGVTSNPGTFTSTYQLTSTQTQIYVAFAPPGNPGNSCAAPPVGGNVVITGIAAGGVSQTFNFPY